MTQCDLYGRPTGGETQVCHLQHAILMQVYANEEGVSRNNEVDLSASARGAFIIEHSSFYDDVFRADIKGAERGSWPGKRYDFAKADRSLNDIYKKVLADEDRFSDSSGGVTPQDVRNTQRLWLKYRDEFVAFMKLRHPKIPGDAVKTALTHERIKTLSVIPSSAPAGDE